MLRQRLRNALILAPFVLASWLPLHAEAAKWITLGERNGAKIEIEASSIDRSGDDQVRIWHRESYTKARIPDSGAFSYTRLSAFTEYQCARRLAAPLSRTYVASDGSELKSEHYASKDAAPIAPDSIAELILNYACKRKPARVAPPVEVVPAPSVAPSEVVANLKKAKPGKSEPPAPVEPVHVHWDYDGKSGTGKWSKLTSEYATCGTGLRQSPIDIRETIGADLPPIRFAYKTVPLSIIDNGHTVQVNTAGAGKISVDNEDYELLQFHFHRPSEEKINGKGYDMVAHLVHKSAAGKLAVVAVLLQAGREQRLIRSLWNNLPLEQNKSVERPEVNVDPSLLLPDKRHYFTYMGSLTTPPCSEDVLWLVLKTPTQVSREQIASFGKIYRNNARPIQTRNMRVIKESR